MGVSILSGVGRIAAPTAMRRVGMVTALLAAVLVLGGCSASMIDSLPTEFGGLPAAAPKRPDAPAQYPAAFGAPTRTTTPLTAAQQLELEENLNDLRARQKGLQKPAEVTRAQAEAEKIGAARQRAIDAANANQGTPRPR